jgi:hypothetical protein
MNPRNLPPFTRDFLQATRSLLTPQDVWIKRHVSTDKRGQPIGYWDERACRFSLDGALLRVSHITQRPLAEVYQFVRLAIHPRGITPVAHWNDASQTTHLAVIELLNRCIVQLGGEAQDFYASLGDDDGK